MAAFKRLAGTWMEDAKVLTHADANGMPVGLLTGYTDAFGGFVVKHVVTFRRGVLLTMLRSMIEVGRGRGYAYLLIGIPHDFPPAPKLLRLAERMGFAPIDRDAERAVWVRYYE